MFGDVFNSSDVTDKRFYGVYRGIVVDSNDPKGRGRVKLKVPQILGNAVTGWAWSVTGSIVSAKLPYATLTNNTQDTNIANQVNLVLYDTLEDSGGGVYFEGSKVYAPQNGDYLVNFSPQFSSSTSTNVQADVWLRVNGTDVPRSATRVTMQGNPNEVVITIPFIIDLKAGDYFEVAWSSASTAVTLKPFTNLTNPVRPDIPSVITTISMIGNYTPSIGTGVWVMFEGGDPNFPLWIGAF